MRKLNRKAAVVFRQFQEQDAPKVRALHQETEAAVGQKLDLPNLADHPVLRAEVAEKKGELKGGFYFESVPEVCFFGRDPEVTVSAVRHAPEVLGRLKSCGFRIVRIQVPRSLSEREREMIREELKKVGFYSTDKLYEHYTVDMRERVQ